MPQFKSVEAGFNLFLISSVGTYTIPVELCSTHFMATCLACCSVFASADQPCNHIECPKSDVISIKFFASLI